MRMSTGLRYFFLCSIILSMETLSRRYLDELHSRYHRLENLAPDPLIFARGYEDPLEGEVAGLIASGLAYGRVELIVRTLGVVFSRLGPRPREALLTASARELSSLFGDFCYRFNKGEDFSLFLWLVRGTLVEHGSLRGLFSSVRDGDYRATLTRFTDRVFGQDPRPLLSTREIPKNHPARYLLTSPGQGSAAKRLSLYLRWMNRRDELDPGYWLGEIDPAALVVPLDTHVAKVGRAYGLTSRKSADWLAANEITDALRGFYPTDPLRYDFSLFRFGMQRVPKA